MATIDLNPYAAPEAPLADAPHDDDGAPLADRGTRLAAALIDGLLMVAAAVPGGIAAAAAGRGGDDPPVGLLAALIGGAWIALLGVQWYLVATTGQSLAKRWLRIRVVKLDGRQVGFVDGVVLRTWVTAALGLVPIVGGLVSFVDPLMIFGQERRCLHDYIAGTKVVTVVPEGP